MFAQSNVELLERPADREWMKRYLAVVAEKSEADEPVFVPALAPDAEALMNLLTNREPKKVPALIRKLSSRIRNELTAVNPAAHDLSALQARVILVHGRHDDIIPYTESIDLAQALSPEQVQLFLIEGVAHVDLKLHQGDLPKLLQVMTLLLDQRGPP